jgi:hypothetical protein
MRSPTSLLAAAALLSACGTWSNEDLRFLEALPTRQDLRVEVPESAAAATAGSARLAACGGLGEATVWGWARPTSDGLNRSVDWVLSLVDAVRRVPPTERLEDGRIWGPFDDRRHPGRQIRVVMLRAARGDLGGLLEHTYAFEARVGTGGPFTAIISGSFLGASASRGAGTLELDFDAVWNLGLADPDAPRGRMRVDYDRQGEPRTVALSLVQTPGFGLERFDYAFAGYLDGSGRFDYAFRNAGDLVTVAAGFTGAGAGRAQVAFFPAAGGQGGFRQCWDAAACLTWVDDPLDYSCGAPGCSGGSESACPVVPLVP